LEKLAALIKVIAVIPVLMIVPLRNGIFTVVRFLVVEQIVGPLKRFFDYMRGMRKAFKLNPMHASLVRENQVPYARLQLEWKVREVRHGGGGVKERMRVFVRLIVVFVKPDSRVRF
jgi:hypothetical protein